MSITISAIIGSPKKRGESIEHFKLYEQALIEYPDAKFNYIYLKDYNIKECIGCSNCFDKGENSCPHKDDLGDIINQINKSEGIMFMSPVYSLHITATMKLFIDRLSYLFHRSECYDKKGFIVAPKAQLIPFGADYLQKILKGWLIDVQGTSRLAITKYLPAKKQDKQLQTIRQQMKGFYTSIKQGRRKSPSITELISFNVWKQRAMGKGSGNADYDFFQLNGLFDKPYFYEVRIPLIKQFFASLLFRITHTYMRNMLGDLKQAI